MTYFETIIKRFHRRYTHVMDGVMTLTPGYSDWLWKETSQLVSPGPITHSASLLLTIHRAPKLATPLQISSC